MINQSKNNDNYLTEIEAEMQQILENDALELSENLSDSSVIEDERAFRQRFGPGFSFNRRQRASLMKLKSDRDFTDRQIRVLKWSGNLKTTPFQVTLSPSVAMAVWGGILLLPVIGLIILGLAITGESILLGRPVTFKGMLTIGGLLTIAWLGYVSYIQPWLISRRYNPTKAPSE